MIRFYQLTLGSALAPSCRYWPSCSEYGLEAVERFGLLRGTVLTAWRVLRCNPLARGGYDPVPADFKVRFLTREHGH